MPTIYNKVTANGTTLIDLSQDTVASASHIRQGYVGHLNDGTQVTGSYSGSSPSLQTKTNIDPTESSQTIEADSGYDGLDSVQINAISSSYVGSGVSRQAAQTIHPSTTDQTISSGKYLTGTQTIKAVTTTNLSASNILSGVTVKVGDSTDDDCVASVTGSVAFQTYYTGSSVPSSSLGANGDIYLQTS